MITQIPNISAYSRRDKIGNRARNGRRIVVEDIVSVGRGHRFRFVFADISPRLFVFLSIGMPYREFAARRVTAAPRRP